MVSRPNGTRRVVTARAVALLVGVLVLVSPVLRDRDSFPLSTYPVYSSARSNVATFVTARGVDGDGVERRLSMAVIARTDDPLIASSRLSRAAAADADGLCADIARRAPAWTTEIVVVREQHDVVASARGDESVLDRDELARCEVPS